MYKMFRALLGGVMAACIAAGWAGAATAATVYEFSPSSTFYNVNGDGLLAHIRVATPVTITSFAQKSLSTAPINLKFVVYDVTHNQMLYSSSGKLFPADAGVPSFKKSDDFPAITLEAGGDYAIGVLSNGNHQVYYAVNAPAVQNGITNVGWANTGGYSSPLPITANLLASSMSLQLSYDEPPVPVPTLSEWAMMLMGLMLAGGAVFYVHRRRSVAA